MATPKNPPVMIRITKGTRIAGEEEGEMVSLQPDGCGGPIIEVKAGVAADLVHSNRAEVISGDKEYKAAAVKTWQANLAKAEKAEKAAA